MVFADIADGVARGIESAQSAVSEALFEPVIRLGVTGLARAGKTVFVTSLVANLLDRNRMGHVGAIREGRVEAAFLQPQPDDTLPRFDYEANLAALLGQKPHWPESTRNISQLRISLRVQPGGLLSGLAGPRRVHVDIVDYPGEWLLDLSLIDQDYAGWSAAAISRARGRAYAADWLRLLDETDGAAALGEPRAQALAAAFTDYLRACRAAGLSDCTPGRFLLPGDLAGSPVLTFSPLPQAQRAGRGSLHREMGRRFDAYKSKVVKPFFRDHFARIDRQIVLVDVLGAIHAGPEAVEDMRRAMASVLGAFRPGPNSFLSRLLVGRRVERVLIAATKADHLHHRQHPALTAIAQAMLNEAKARAEYAGAGTDAMSIAALRATVEESRSHEGRKLDLVRGTLEGGRQAALYAGELPEEPAAILGPAHDGEAKWLDADYSVMAFEPPKLSLRAGEGPPHIRMDRAVEFLIGDRV